MITSRLTIAVAVLAAASMVAAPLLLGEQAFATEKKIIKKTVTVTRDNIVNQEQNNNAVVSDQCSNLAGVALLAQANTCAAAQTQINAAQTGAIVDESTNSITVDNNGNGGGSPAP